MTPVAYSFFSYALTAVISYAVIGIIVLINRVMSAQPATKKEGGK